MTRVDFYISPNQSVDAQQQLACRISEKAYQQNHKVHIFTNSPEQSAALDALLWIFRPGSFIPHCLSGDVNTEHAAVVISHSEQPHSTSASVLINLTTTVPPFFSRYERVAEVVAGDEKVRQHARERFKYYRERGYPLSTHEMNS